MECSIAEGFLINGLTWLWEGGESKEGGRTKGMSVCEGEKGRVREYGQL